MSERSWLALILLATTLIGWSYAVVNPVFEGGDELWHYPMVQHLAEGNPLPVQVMDAALAGPWKQQASQPPLYYYFAAWLTGWIDTSDMPEIRWQNPHVDNGIITADGNTNLTIHNPNWNPVWGTMLAVRLVRFASVLMGVVTVFFTYHIGKLAAPERSDVALGAAALVAFLPMRLFVSAAVNNDNGIIMLATITVFLLIRFVVTAGPTTTRWAHDRQAVTIGIVIGLACLTKIIGIGLLPLALGALILGSWKTSDVQHSLPQRLRFVLGRTARLTIFILIITFIIAGWWYIRNVRLYDDWRGWSAFIAVLGKRNQPATLAQLWGERFGFMTAYWGLFGGVNIPLPLPIYHFLNAMTTFGVFGFVWYAAVQIGRFWQSKRPSISPSQIISLLLDFASTHAAIVICVVWMAAVVVGLIDWATDTWSSQGRLVFGALQAELVLLTLGLIGWLNERIGRLIIGALATFLFLVAALSPFLVIRPAYALTTIQASNVQPIATFDESVALLATLPNFPKAITAGDSFEVCLDWQIMRETDRNWSVFIHLNDPILDNPIAQRDMYLAQGLLGTSFATRGTAVRDCYQLNVNATAISPAELSLDVGLYDFDTFERARTARGADHVSLGRIELEETVALDTVNPRANFGDEIQLVGFSLDQRRIIRGNALLLTLHLLAPQQLDSDYSVTAQIVSEDLTDTTRWAAADVSLASSQWASNEVQTVQLEMAVNPETQSGIYRLILGVYTQTDDGFRNLSLVSADGRITNDNLLTLTKVRIDE